MIHDISPAKCQPDRALRLKLGICLLLAAALFFWMNSYFFHFVAQPVPVASLRFITKILYIINFLIGLAALLSSVTASKGWAWLSGLVFGANLLIGVSFFFSMERPLSILDAQMLYAVSDNQTDVLSALTVFGPAVLKAVAAVALLMAMVIWPRRWFRLRTNVPLCVLTLTFIFSYGLRLLVRGDPAVIGLPTNFTPGLAVSSLMVTQVAEHFKMIRKGDFTLKSVPRDSAIRHIVLVVDESIASEVFSSIFRDVPVDNVRDFGTAFSYANCSEASNYMLRRGGNPMDMDDSLGQLPSLFELAKQSRFKTSFLDAQDALRDRFFSPKERLSVDSIPPIDKFGKWYDRDLNAVGILSDVLRTNERTFTILNKVGSHFPYKRNLPPNLAGVTDPYRAAVQRSTVGFLTRLAGVLPPGTLVFYTSDHGQNFHSKVSHCNLPGDSSVSEWLVPMLVLYSKDLQGVVNHVDAGWKNHASHAALAETVRNLLGYEISWGRSLFSGPDNSRLHRGFYGPPPFFGHCNFLVIDKEERVFRASAEEYY
jgi:glucan phosphoethanolaminetransferase (alkaline phosphatase superfamily)